MELRETIEWFAGYMESKLREHDKDKGKHGWVDCANSHLFDLIKTEVLKLEKALSNMDHCSITVMRSAADLANFAMMIADNCNVQRLKLIELDKGGE